MPIGFQTGLRLVDWILSGASVDLDFANNRFFGSSGGSVSSYLSVVRASIANAKNSTGAWVQFPVNTLRITDLGLLIENAGTNYLLQSETPATQTTASLGTGSYTLWVEGSGSALASGGSATITGAASATAGSPDTFNVTVAGTVVVTVTGPLTRFQLEGGAFSTSYIPTTSTTATRAADNVSCLGSLATARPFNSPASIVFNTLMIPGSTSGVDVLWSTGGANPRDVEVDNTTTFDDYYNGAGHTATLPGGLDFTTTGAKCGVAWDGSGNSVVCGGGTVTTWGAGSFDGSNPKLGYDYVFAGATRMYGYIRRLTVWDTKLANATLQALTT
jgi:hypothetical protein